MNVHPTSSTYTDPKDLLAEQTRVFDVCASCRRCFNLCPSFPTLFDYIDEEADFEAKALELCDSKSNYNILEKKIEVLEIDETPAYGLETKLKIGINGVVECK